MTKQTSTKALTHTPLFRTAVLAVTLLSTAAASQTALAQTTEPVRLRYEFPSVGLVDGQTLRTSVFYPPDPCRATSTDTATEPCRARVLLLDAAGERLFDSGLFALPPGPVRTFDVDRANIARPGEPGTGRVQVRAVVMVVLPAGTVLDPNFPPDPCRTAVEIVATTTGRTTLHLSPGTIRGFNPQPDPPRE